jgi:hypothetical protein
MTPDTEGGPRCPAYQELQEVLNQLQSEGCKIDPKEHLSPTDMADALYNDSLRF